MKLKYAILYVEDVAKTLAFYEQAFGFQRRMLHEGGDYGELDTGETVLSFSSLQLMADLGKSPVKADLNASTFHLSFETNDVKAKLEQAVSSGAELVQAATEQPWGQTTSYVSDFNGFLIEICSPVRN